MGLSLLDKAEIFSSYVGAGGRYGVVDFLQRRYRCSAPTIRGIIGSMSGLLGRGAGRPKDDGVQKENKELKRQIDKLQQRNEALEQKLSQEREEKKDIQRAIWRTERAIARLAGDFFSTQSPKRPDRS